MSESSSVTSLRRVTSTPINIPTSSVRTGSIATSDRDRHAVLLRHTEILLFSIDWPRSRSASLTVDATAWLRVRSQSVRSISPAISSGSYYPVTRRSRSIVLGFLGACQDAYSRSVLLRLRRKEKEDSDHRRRGRHSASSPEVSSGSLYGASERGCRRINAALSSILGFSLFSERCTSFMRIIIYRHEHEWSGHADTTGKITLHSASLFVLLSNVNSTAIIHSLHPLSANYFSFMTPWYLTILTWQLIDDDRFGWDTAAQTKGACEWRKYFHSNRDTAENTRWVSHRSTMNYCFKK